jgi:crotonobetainyl-CoA:carnitine CoA-transferase CaiB-like acyl-CoA transferase
MMPLLRSHMKRFSARELSIVFEQHSLPFAPITKPEELFDDPHLVATGGLAALTLPDGRFTHVPLMPMTLGGARPGLRLNPPTLGEHTDDVLSELGYSREQILAMRNISIARTD